MQPLPPIVVNVPAATGPPWWATGLIALASALIALIATALVTRGREHQKWLWENRADAYLRAVRVAASARRYAAQIESSLKHWEAKEWIERTPIDPSKVSDASGDVLFFGPNDLSNALHDAVYAAGALEVIISGIGDDALNEAQMAIIQENVTKSRTAYKAVVGVVARELQRPPRLLGPDEVR